MATTLPTPPNAAAIQNAVEGLAQQEGAALQAALTSIVPVANGVAVLVAGAVTITNASVTATAIIKVWNYGGAGTVGALSVTAAAGSFTIHSSSGTDTSKVLYEIVAF
jgi:hypothetical protein